MPPFSLLKWLFIFGDQTHIPQVFGTIIIVAPEILDLAGSPISKAQLPDSVFIPAESISAKHNFTEFESVKHLSSVTGQIPPLARVAARIAYSFTDKSMAQH